MHHAGAGDPFDRYHTFVDGCLQLHRATEMPISGFVTFDMVQGRTRSSSREAFERGAWWLAARTSLHHDWYVEAGDLTAQQWKLLARAAKWAKAHETVFPFRPDDRRRSEKRRGLWFCGIRRRRGHAGAAKPERPSSGSLKADWPTCWTCPEENVGVPINCAASSERPSRWKADDRLPKRCGSNCLLSGSRYLRWRDERPRTEQSYAHGGQTGGDSVTSDRRIETVNGPSVARIARTMPAGWKRYKDHTDFNPRLQGLG